MRVERKQIIWAIIPVFIVFWLYKGVLGANFNWEDAMLLGDAAKALTKGNWWYTFTPWWGAYARPFWQPISVVLYGIFGYNATPFFALSLAFHLINVFLVYLLALRLTGSKFISFFSSLFFGVYQINFEGPTWLLSGLKDVPMTMFFLLSFLFFLNFFESNKKKLLFVSCFFYFLALTCELKALMIPGVFLVYQVIFGKKFDFKSLAFRFLPYAAVCLFFLLFVYFKMFGKFATSANWDFWQTFPASIPFYFLPISRIYWLKIKFDSLGFSEGKLDEHFLVNLGALILLFWLGLCVFFTRVKEIKRLKIISFLLLGVLVNYFPVMLTVFSNYQTLWQTVTIHWRYFTLSSSLASILVATSFTWLAEKIIRKTILVKIFCFFIFSVLIMEFIKYDRFMLSKFLNWTLLARKNFQVIKNSYPRFPPESVLVIEGAEKEDSKLLFFQNRYLLENLFALYANPNNPYYLTKQRELPLDPNEGPARTAKELLYYTNLKEILVGEHGHIYQEDSHWMALNLPWRLPAYDRLFLGMIYGLYDPKKLFVFSLKPDGNIEDITQKRVLQASEFFNMYCFDKGLKTCQKKYNQVLFAGEFSLTGKKIVEKLISFPAGPLPKLSEIEVN